MNQVIFENLIEASISIDANKRIKFCNKALLRKIGYTKKDLIGQKLFDFIHINDLANFKKNLEKVKNNFPLDFIKCRLQRKEEHKYIHFNFRIVSEFKEKARIFHLIENKLIEDSSNVVSSNENAPKIQINIDDIPMKILSADFQKTYQYLSKFNLISKAEFIKFFTFQPEKLKRALMKVKILQFNQKLAQKFHITHPKQLIPRFSESLINEIQVQLYPFLFDIIQNHKKGEFKLIFKDKEKKINYFIINWMISEKKMFNYENVVFVISDETKKKSLQNVLDQTEHKYKRIIETFGGEIYTCSEDHIVEYANAEAIRKHNTNPIGTKCFTAIYGLDQRCPWCQNEKLFQEKMEMEGEKFNPRNNRWYHVIITPNFSLLGKRSKTVVMIDITEIKEAKDVLTTRSKRLEFLNEIYKKKFEGNTLEDYFMHLLQSSFLIGDYNAGGIIVFEEALKDGLLVAQSNMSKTLIEEICKNQFEIVDICPTFINDIQFYIPQLKLDSTIGAIAFVPILSMNKEIGILILIKESSIEFSNPEMEFLLSLGEELGMIIKSVKADLELKESLSEKDILLKEIHHRVKNNLQIIISLFNLQTRNIKDSKIKEFFEDSKNRIKSMSLIHEILYQTENYAKINYNRYIRSLVGNLIRSYRKNVSEIHTIFDIDEISIDINDAIPLALILNELVSNALKYAFPKGIGKKTLKISLKKHNNQVVLTVMDNGIGVPKDLDLTSSKTLGLRLVSMLSAQLNGTYNILNEKGTKVQILFKVNEI
ncbi:hypothetical protein NEF87_004605 [Candidatus Lokiarchaeum ossiferum]|uniref:PAS domain S-box protein n=1 Tax=Candidatus Lokiarchaeum ossiferum TaxID=2951803 RepID=A0ABY6HY20_9ARCH|nr:hypothetical protein NEF87_004605 [Candidatus Lokiarchaeum sp. B-35]